MNLPVSHKSVSLRRTRPTRPRLLYILHQYFSQAGTEIHTKALVDGLKNQYDILIAFPHRDKICIVDTDDKITSFPATPVAWPDTAYRAPQTEASLSRILNTFKPDIIHIQHFLQWPLSVIDQLVQTGKPVVMTFHDYYSITPNFTIQGAEDVRQVLSPNYSLATFNRNISDYLIKRLEVMTKSLGNLTARITPSRFLTQELSKIFPLDFKVIEHGIHPFSRLPAKKYSAGLHFGYIGSLMPQKGWDLLAKAFAPVCKSHPTTSLHFYGQSYGERQDISFNGCDRIHFYGKYDPRELPHILSQIDIGFIPSVVRETYCLALSEMWLGGLPVAVSDIGALGERVTDGVNGKVFPPGDIQAMTQTFLWFIDHDEWEKWNIPKPRLAGAMIHDYDSLYQSLI